MEGRIWVGCTIVYESQDVMLDFVKGTEPKRYLPYLTSVCLIIIQLP